MQQVGYQDPHYTRNIDKPPTPVAADQGVGSYSAMRPIFCAEDVATI
jgi:hypothetical protein